MYTDYQIPEPFQFNQLKHHFGYIREFISFRMADENVYDLNNLVRELKHIGTSVMDVYTGPLSINDLCVEIKEFLNNQKLNEIKTFLEWTGRNYNDVKTVTLSDQSKWILKYNNDETRYVHIFPARLSPHSFRVKSNTMKSALLYYIIIGKDFISREDLNRVRKLLDLSPVKDATHTDAITEMIEILRK